MSCKEGIKKRRSVRKYTDEKVELDILKTIRHNLNTYEPIRKENRGQIRFKVMESSKEAGLGFLWGLGRINAPYCMVGIVKSREQQLEVGFAIEQQVLYLTEQGIGTCWLGTFNRTYFAKQCQLTEDEEVCIIVVFGYSTEKGFLNKGFRRLAGSTKRKPLAEIALIPEKEISALDREVIEMGILAPSGNNMQPVRVLPDKGALHLYQRKNAYIDTGIFLAHCYVMLREQQEAGKIANIRITMDGENTQQDLQEVACLWYDRA